MVADIFAFSAVGTAQAQQDRMAPPSLLPGSQSRQHAYRFVNKQGHAPAH